jgi:hypothetical protein
MDVLGSQIFNGRVLKFGINAASACLNIRGLTAKQYLHPKNQTEGKYGEPSPGSDYKEKTILISRNSPCIAFCDT